MAMQMRIWAAMSIHMPAGVSGRKATAAAKTVMDTRTAMNVAFLPIFSETGTVTTTPTSCEISPTVRNIANV